MRQMIGCAAMVAAIPLLISLVVSLLVRDVPFSERVVIAMLPAVITFVAATFLFTLDTLKYKSHVTAVRNAVRDRMPVGDEEFYQHFPDIDANLLRLTREGIAEFFDVPPETIHPTDDLNSDLYFSSLEPEFHSFVTYYVLAECGAIEAPFTFRSGPQMSNIGSLAREISRILRRLPNVADADGEAEELPSDTEEDL